MTWTCSAHAGRASLELMLHTLIFQLLLELGGNRTLLCFAAHGVELLH